MNLFNLKLTKKREEICNKFGFSTIEDVLSFYPYKYDEYNVTPFSEFIEGKQVFFEGMVISNPTIFRKGKLTISKFKVLYEDNELLVTIFNRPWIRNIELNKKISIIGKYEGFNKVTAFNYYEKSIDNIAGIVPSYSIKENVNQNEIKKLIKYVYENSIKCLSDDIPSDLLSKHQLISYEKAIKNIHFPSNKKELALAMSRLKYEEFLRFYVALNVLKGEGTSLKTVKIFENKKINDLIKSFPFELTIDQKNAIDEILSDLSSNKIMYRLVQGEVGSGKTAVAIVGLYANYLSGFQGALMAPTEILAKQHFDTLNNALSSFGVKVGLLYSAMNDEALVKEKIKNNEYDIVVGTHALFSIDVEFNNLGLVIADEQHRFGVRQRKALKDKGKDCDFLLMSATPIPRTLASSIYGDMDISTIHTMPKDRKPCETVLINKNSIVDILDKIKSYLKQGHQIYIVAAAIEKSENYSAKDVNGLFNSLKDELSPFNVCLLHGKLSSSDKEDVMNRFKHNDIQVLISTTVVEVGVNVPNATMMIIYDADKFGLSQLHQLRGRIQRSNSQSYCYLLTSNNDENVLKRLEVLTKTNDGFEISYEDLKLRGPGDILGTRQSGLPAFILGNLIEDNKFVEAAKEDANLICSNLNNKEYSKYYDKISLIASKKYID